MFAHAGLGMSCGQSNQCLKCPSRYWLRLQTTEKSSLTVFGIIIGRVSGVYRGVFGRVWVYRGESIVIPHFNYIKSIRHCWFVVSFTHVRTTNAKPFKPLSEGVVMKEKARKISI